MNTTTVATLKVLFHEQKENNYNSYDEAYVFGQYKPIQDKKNYVERIDKDSAHMQALENIQQITTSFTKG